MTQEAKLACVAVFLVTLASCERPLTEQAIVIGVDSDASILLPILEESSLDAELNDQLFLGLNEVRWEDGAITYLANGLSLADGWEFSADSTSLTYHIRPDAVWSDGQPITSRDVTFTYELIRRPEIGSHFAEFWEQLDSVIAVNSHDVTFFFSRRYPGMLFHSGLGIMPAHVLEASSSDRSALVSHPAVVEPAGQLVVSGAFQVAEWERGEQIVLEPNLRSFAGRPKVQRVIFRIIPDETTRRIELEAGRVHAITPISMQSAGNLADPERFRIEHIAMRFYDYVAWNPAKNDAFREPDIRRALSLAIDREAILAGVGISDYAIPAGGPYPPIFRHLADPAVRPDRYAPDSAVAILHTHGWDDSDGDGVRDNDGKPLRFTLLTPANHPLRTPTAEILQAQYADVGIDMQVQHVEFNALLDMMFESRDFEAVMLGWRVGLEPDYLVGMFWPSASPLNITGYSSPAVDSMIPLARAASTYEEAAEHWRGIARTIAADRPYAFLWFYDGLVALDRNIQGARIDSHAAFQTLHEWTISQ